VEICPAVAATPECMRRKCLWLAAVILLASGNLRAAETADVPGQAHCTDAASATEFRDCLEKQARARAVLVKAAEQAVMDAIARSGEEARFKSDARALFDASRQMFQAHRTAACEVAAATAGGGTGASRTRLICQEELDLDWMVYLRDLAARFSP